MRKVIIILLSITILFSCAVPAFAEKEGEVQPEACKNLYIETEEEFLSFVRDCRLDSYSRNLRVYLKKDLNLAGMNFRGVPIFCGTFYGNVHTISGISLREEGSYQGFFRYLTDTAGVFKLSLEGKVHPQGSAARTGGFAGSNAGVIKGCSFRGEVSGTDRVGGIAGINRVTGVIEDCEVFDTVHGNHFVGGIAGENMGLIRSCKNSSDVNATESQNKVDLSGITLETISGVEAANTVTDIGGIAGTNGGVLRNCDNLAVVGYLHIGYNVGGIAGSQQGYMENCRNFGQVFGRKEVGGIVGQMEPVIKMEYSVDTLQILEQQLSGTAALTSQAAANAKNNALSLDGQLSELQGQAESALNAVETLLPDPEHPKFPDKDSIIAAHSAFNSSMTAMQGTMSGIASSTASAAATLESDIKSISAQLNAMGRTLNEATENIGATFTDISDQDTDDDYSGKIENCSNSGQISGDLNAGGIVGAISWESDLDPEKDIQVTGENSLKFDSEVRAVVVRCKNKGEITVKRRNAGGIAGWVSMGLVRDCGNSGRILAESAQYVGGVAGNSTGFIRNCRTKCEIAGRQFVGGIAGSGTVVTSCRSVAKIEEVTEQAGAILGSWEKSRTDSNEDFQGNYYLAMDEDWGAVDGISYAGLGEPLSAEQFYALPDLGELFLNSTVTFLAEDGTETEVVLTPGAVLDDSKVPEVPVKTGYVGEWKNLKAQIGKGVFFDQVYLPQYTAYRTSIRSEEERADGRAVLLVEGEFPQAGRFAMERLTNLPYSVHKDEKGIEGWEIPELQHSGEIQLRYGAPEGYDPELLKIIIQGKDKNLRVAETRVSDSYLVFSVSPDDWAFYIMSRPEPTPWLRYIGEGVLSAAVIALVIFLVCRKRKKKKAAGKK